MAETLKTGDLVQHPTFGIGQVAEVSSVSIVIDFFADRRPMASALAHRLLAEGRLKVLPPDGLAALRLADPHRTLRLVADQPGEAVVAFLRDRAAPGQPRVHQTEIRAALDPLLPPGQKWEVWWKTAREKLQHHPLVDTSVPNQYGLRVQPRSRADELAALLMRPLNLAAEEGRRSSRAPQEQLNAARELIELVESGRAPGSQLVATRRAVMEIVDTPSVSAERRLEALLLAVGQGWIPEAEAVARLQELAAGGLSLARLPSTVAMELLLPLLDAPDLPKATRQTLLASALAARPPLRHAVYERLHEDLGGSDPRGLVDALADSMLAGLERTQERRQVLLGVAGRLPWVASRLLETAASSDAPISLEPVAAAALSIISETVRGDFQAGVPAEPRASMQEAISRVRDAVATLVVFLGQQLSHPAGDAWWRALSQCLPPDEATSCLLARLAKRRATAALAALHEVALTLEDISVAVLDAIAEARLTAGDDSLLTWCSARVDSGGAEVAQSRTAAHLARWLCALVARADDDGRAAAIPALRALRTAAGVETARIDAALEEAWLPFVREEVRTPDAASTLGLDAGLRRSIGRLLREQRDRHRAESARVQAELADLDAQLVAARRDIGKLEHELEETRQSLRRPSEVAAHQARLGLLRGLAALADEMEAALRHVTRRGDRADEELRLAHGRVLQLLAENGVTPYGELGVVVGFNPERHQFLGPAGAVAGAVVIEQRGYLVPGLGGETAVLKRAVVVPAQQRDKQEEVAQS